MGDRLDYERGKLCIGRRVRVWMATGRGNGKNGSPAVLKGASPKSACVRFQGHGHDEFVPWDRVFDWIGGNGGAAPKPPKATVKIEEPTAAEHIELNRAFAATQNQKAADLLREAVKEADMQTDLATLGERIKAKVESVKAARASVREAEGVLATEMQELDRLQMTAKTFLADLDKQIGECKK